MIEKRRTNQDVALLMALAAAVLLGIQLVLFIAAARAMPLGARDFRAFYSAGVILRSGHANLLYNDALEAQIQAAAVGPLAASLPFLYPPFAALLFVPLAALSYSNAFVVFALVNLVFALITAHLLTRNAALPFGGMWLGPAVVLAFHPLCITLLQGQVSVLLLLLFCTCGHALARNRPFVAGVCLALTLIKFQLALPIALLFLLWRRWKVLQGFAAGAVALLAISLAIVGAPSLLSYAASVGGLEHRVAAGVTDYGHLLIKMPNIYGLACLVLGNHRSAVLATVAASVALLGWARTRRPSLPVAVLVALLVSYHLLPYDLTLLLLPLAAHAGKLWGQMPVSTEAHPSTRGRVGAGVTILFLLPPVYMVLEREDLVPLLVLPVFVFLILLAEPKEEPGAVLLSVSPPAIA